MKNRRAGFTLIEAVVTIAIFGILAALAIPTYAGFVRNSKLSEVHG